MPSAPQSQIALAPHTTLELGGPAQYFVRIETPEALHQALQWADHHTQPVTILGGGSNVVIADRGVQGLVIQLATRGVSFEQRGQRMLATVAAGERWDDFVAETVRQDLAGLECLSGIPGSVGATPLQNVGAYGQEVSSCIEAVEVLDRSDASVHWLDNVACAFSYRNSRLKREAGRFVVQRVRFSLEPGGKPSLRYAELSRALAAVSGKPSLAQVRLSVLGLRRSKAMLIEAGDENRRSAGSFFLNPIVSCEQADAIAARAADTGANMPRYPQADGRHKLAAGWLIEHAGIKKGERLGQVGVSSKHALALVHHGAGTSAELIVLARQVRERVAARFGVELEPEPVMLGFATPPFG